MDDSPATLELAEGESPIITGDMPAQAAGRRGMKFSYVSGSQPLKGYTIKRGIGIGGFGEVYFALSDAGKEVALKKIQRNLDIELRGVRQCLNLKHVNLISLWDIRTSEHGESWVVMEYVPGPSLRDVVESHPEGMPTERVKDWFISTASGVSYLHEHGIVHRDLKPGNIFRDEDEQVIKIGDYGLSKFISCSRRSGQTESVGTFHYMAPEIGKGVYGKEIDIYALGIILFEMVTGTVPFEGESVQEIIMKHLTADPVLDIVPQKYRDVIGKSLRKDPSLRYRNVPEMIADLPWPEIAADSKKIISRHSVGPLAWGDAALRQANKSTTGPKTSQSESIVVADATDAETPAIHPSQLPPMIISGDEVEVVPDIIFGPLTDNSQHPQSSNGFASASPPPAVPHQALNQRQAPIQIIDPNGAPPPRFNDPSQPGAIDQEPIAQAVKFGFKNLGHWWSSANLSTPVKIILLVVAGIVVVKNSQWLLPLVMVLAAAYLVYVTSRAWFLWSPEKPPQPSPREIQRKKIAQVRHWISGRPLSDRITELIGSLLVGAFACVVLNLLGLALDGGVLDSSVEVWAKYCWLTLISVIACWAVLGCSKMWEEHEADGWLRRFVMLSIGLGVGLIAFFSANAFNLDLSRMALQDFQSRRTEQFVFHGFPMLPAYLIFFAGLFGILRWWRQTDPVRSTRLSIWNVLICLIAATAFSHLLNVPLSGNCILAVVISVAVQLASPWLHPSNREEIYEELHDKSLASPAGTS